MTKPQYSGYEIGSGEPITDRPHAKPPLNTYIKWDGSETPPVPVGTEVTLWFKETDYSQQTLRTSGQILVWRDVTAYLVHAYPPEETVRDCWLEINSDGIAFYDDLETDEETIAFAHIRFTNGVFEIVSQEKA